MTNRDASAILEALLYGVNPITGEVLPKDHVCQEPEVLRALHKALTALQPCDVPPANSNAPINRNGKLNAGRPWAQEELDQLKQLHEDGISMEEMCSLLQRKKRGIEKQLLYLGLTDDVKGRTAVNPKRPRAGAPWTSDEDLTLWTMWKQEKTVHEIAAALQRSAYAIHCRMERLGMLEQEATTPPPKDNPSV